MKNPHQAHQLPYILAAFVDAHTLLLHGPQTARQAEVRQADPSLTEPSLAEPSLAEPSLAEPGLAEPSQAVPRAASQADVLSLTQVNPPLVDAESLLLWHAMALWDDWGVESEDMGQACGSSLRGCLLSELHGHVLLVAMHPVSSWLFSVPPPIMPPLSWQIEKHTPGNTSSSCDNASMLCVYNSVRWLVWLHEQMRLR